MIIKSIILFSLVFALFGCERIEKRDERQKQDLQEILHNQEMIDYKEIKINKDWDEVFTFKINGKFCIAIKVYYDSVSMECFSEEK